MPWWRCGPGSHQSGGGSGPDPDRPPMASTRLRRWPRRDRSTTRSRLCIRLNKAAALRSKSRRFMLDPGCFEAGKPAQRELCAVHADREFLAHVDVLHDVTRFSGTKCVVWPSRAGGCDLLGRNLCASGKDFTINSGRASGARPTTPSHWSELHRGRAMARGLRTADRAGVATAKGHRCGNDRCGVGGLGAGRDDAATRRRALQYLSRGMIDRHSGNLHQTRRPRQACQISQGPGHT
jgi:hypothetical protein